MHDTFALESLGIAGVIVASTEFRDAVIQGSNGLGFDPAVVYVQHPIQDRSDAEMADLADTALPALLHNLTATASEGGGT